MQCYVMILINIGSFLYNSLNNLIILILEKILYWAEFFQLHSLWQPIQNMLNLFYIIFSNEENYQYFNPKDGENKNYYF